MTGPTDDMRACLKGQFDDLHVGIGGGHLKHAENVLPARANVLRLRVNEVRDAANDHVTDRR